jgi:hypothetical protein
MSLSRLIQDYPITLSLWVFALCQVYYIWVWT